MATLDVSPNDDRSYRLITLDNGLRALLASDPTAEHGAAAMAVNVGAAHDPTGLPGLAHFCEHMLFLGSEKRASLQRSPAERAVAQPRSCRAESAEPSPSCPRRWLHS